MQEFDLNEHSHNRKNILTNEWILVSPHRSKRPWQGKVEIANNIQRPVYDDKCYLCPGNVRSDGVKENPDYSSTYIFENDFSALKNDSPKGEINKNNLLIANSESGVCKVICFSPRHDLTLAEMNILDIKSVIDTWINEYLNLSKSENINYIQIFENKGDMMGCSNPHPHGQIWAESSIPNEIVKESNQFNNYYKTNNKSLLSDYIDIEIKEKERIVFENQSFIVLVPFWATWPFETIIISKRHIQNISLLNENEKNDFAEAIKIITVKYDNLFNTSFPYSAGIHQSPTDNNDNTSWHMHMHFYPPLLRSATIKKFMVGYEMLATPQRDITPEHAAKQLRELSTVHYKEITEKTIN